MREICALTQRLTGEGKEFAQPKSDEELLLALLSLGDREALQILKKRLVARGATVLAPALPASIQHPGGRFCTLEALATFDERGLWACRGLFSRFGSLIDTVEHFANHSDRGFLASEPEPELQIEVKQPLRPPVASRRPAREELSGRYAYCASDRPKRTDQILQRRAYGTAEARPFSRDPLAQTSDDTKAAIILFLNTLHERQRRRYAGLEFLRLGHGGDSRLAELTGLDVHTIAKGRTELLQRDVGLDRVRRPGGGRPALEKNAQYHRGKPEADGAPHRGRPCHRAEEDPQDDPEDQPGTAKGAPPTPRLAASTAAPIRLPGRCWSLGH